MYSIRIDHQQKNRLDDKVPFRLFENNGSKRGVVYIKEAIADDFEIKTRKTDTKAKAALSKTEKMVNDYNGGLPSTLMNALSWPTTREVLDFFGGSIEHCKVDIVNNGTFTVSSDEGSWSITWNGHYGRYFASQVRGAKDKTKKDNITTEPKTKKMSKLATVTSGKFQGKTVCVLVHFQDDTCICELPAKGNKSGKLKTIKRKRLEFWTSVEFVSSTCNRNRLTCASVYGEVANTLNIRSRSFKSTLTVHNDTSQAIISFDRDGLVSKVEYKFFGDDEKQFTFQAEGRILPPSKGSVGVRTDGLMLSSDQYEPPLEACVFPLEAGKTYEVAVKEIKKDSKQ